MTQKNFDPYFGLCPVCGTSDGFLNIHKANWMICHEHKKCWLRGENLFSSWRYETEEDWERNYQLIKDYEEVEPLTKELTEEERRAMQEKLRSIEPLSESSSIETGRNEENPLPIQADTGLSDDNSDLA